MNQTKYFIHPVVIFAMTFLLLLFSLSPAAPAEFFYDAQGRLVGVRDEIGNMAVHRYDHVGNLLSIDNFSQTTGNVGIFLLLPEKGVVGEIIDIEGFGFSNVSTENTVTFNGSTATVVSSTFDTLTVTVPVGATTGSIVVSNTTGTATSPQPFTILNTPTILGIDPAEVPQGTSNLVTISGSNLINIIGVSFSNAGLNATLRSGATSAMIPITLQVNATTSPGDYTFSLTTAGGVIQSALITIAVRSAVPSIAMTNPLSVFLPRTTDPVSPSGPSIGIAQELTVEMP